MSVITRVAAPNLWDVICKDMANEYNTDADSESVRTVQEDYDAAKHHPAFYGKMVAAIAVDSNALSEFDPSVGHPAVLGHVVLDKPPPTPPPSAPPLPPKGTCSPTAYLENYIFPVLLPAMENMLREAKKEKCFERKRTKFNALDYMTEYLYRNNKSQENREDVTLSDIPFVQDWWKDHPRPPLPKSLLWSEEEATLIIQSHWRGFKVRCDTEIQELRQWQRDWREENANISRKVEDFWTERMGEDGEEEQDSLEGAACENPADIQREGSDAEGPEVELAGDGEEESSSDAVVTEKAALFGEEGEENTFISAENAKLSPPPAEGGTDAQQEAAEQEAAREPTPDTEAYSPR